MQFIESRKNLVIVLVVYCTIVAIQFEWYRKTKVYKTKWQQGNL